MPDSTDTCGRKENLQRSGLKQDQDRGGHPEYGASFNFVKSVSYYRSLVFHKLNSRRNIVPLKIATLAISSCLSVAINYFSIMTLPPFFIIVMKPTDGPDPTEGPEETEEPEPTEGPEETEEPEPTEGPEESEEPEPTEEPEESEEPELTEEPEESEEPEATA